MNAPERELESTASLLEKVRAGDESARDRLLRRYLPLFRRWARGRLPTQVRGMADTDDLVQDCLIRALGHLEDFVPQREGAFLAYLRRICLNRIRDEIDRAAPRPKRVELRDSQPGRGRTPLDDVISLESLRSYERALEGLSQSQREAVILRVELGLPYDQVAEALGDHSYDAARMLVARAMVNMARAMRSDGIEG